MKTVSCGKVDGSIFAINLLDLNADSLKVIVTYCGNSANAVCDYNVKVICAGICGNRYFCLALVSEGDNSTCIYLSPAAAVVSKLTCGCIDGEVLICTGSLLDLCACFRKINSGRFGNCRIANIAYGNISGKISVSEYYCVLAVLVNIYSRAINAVIGNENDRVVGIMKIYGNTVKGKFLAYGIINLHTRNVKLGNGCCLGSFLAGIDNDVIEIEVADRCYGNSGSLSEVTNEGVGRSAYAIDGEVVVTGIGGYGYGSTCGNVEGDESACLHVKSITVLVPSNVAILCANVEACPIESAALCNSSSDVEGVGCTCGAGALIEVVVGSVIYNSLGSIGIPRIKVRNLVIGGAEDYSEVKVHSCFLCGEESHTCNSLGDCACAGVIVLYELNGLVGGLNAGHYNVTLVLRSGTGRGGSDVSTKLALDNCNCSVCAPRTTDSGKTVCNALISGELTVIEDSTVGDSIVSALVRALESGEVTAVRLAGVDGIDHTILEEGGVVSTEDEVGVTVDGNVLEILTAGEELESILVTEKDTILHDKAVCHNKESESSMLCIVLTKSLVEVFLRVECVGNSKVLNGNACSGISDSYSLSRVGGMSKSTCVLKAVERIPLDNYLICGFAQTDNSKVGDSDLKLFSIVTISYVHLLSCVRIDVCSIVESTLDS